MLKTASKSMHNLATLSFLKLVKIDQKRGSKFGAVVAPPDITEKNRNIGAQLQSIVYTTAKRYFGKFTSYVTFGAHKLVRYKPFLDSRCEI